MLFKTLDDIKTYVNFLAQTDISFLKPHLLRAEQKYLRKYLGKTLYDSLNTYISDDSETPTPNEDYDNLLAYIHPALAAFAVKDAVSQLNLSLTDNGFAVAQTGSLTPASKQRTDDLKTELNESAWDGIEALLQYLEENKETYTEWVEGDGYTQAHRNLINSAEEFFNLVDLEISRLFFTILRAEMDNVELLTISGYISPELLAQLKSELESGTISDSAKAIFPDLRRALSNLTIAGYVPEEKSETQSVADKYNINDARRRKYQATGMSYLSRAVTTIKATPANYPAFMESALYTAPVAPYVNEEANQNFIFGGYTS